mmetsp:Transcript_2291/g.5407  ORF Transcript_2291/g.5407 Transcript_2291/m.5407 type:complete len:89 (-) Transcript_2291:908-1174(-)
MEQIGSLQRDLVVEREAEREGGRESWEKAKDDERNGRTGGRANMNCVEMRSGETPRNAHQESNRMPPLKSEGLAKDGKHVMKTCIRSR